MTVITIVFIKDREKKGEGREGEREGERKRDYVKEDIGAMVNEPSSTGIQSRYSKLEDFPHGVAARKAS